MRLRINLFLHVNFPPNNLVSRFTSDHCKPCKYWTTFWAFQITIGEVLQSEQPDFATALCIVWSVLIQGWPIILISMHPAYNPKQMKLTGFMVNALSIGCSAWIHPHIILHTSALFKHSSINHLTSTIRSCQHFTSDPLPAFLYWEQELISLFIRNWLGPLFESNSCLWFLRVQFLTENKKWSILSLPVACLRK